MKKKKGRRGGGGGEKDDEVGETEAGGVDGTGGTRRVDLLALMLRMVRVPLGAESRVLRANYHASMVLMAGGGMGVVTQWIPRRSWRPRCSILPRAADGTGWRGGGGVNTQINNDGHLQ